jgi:transposase-like protein
MRRIYEESERATLVASVKRGESVSAAAQRFGVTISTAYRWLRRSGDGERPTQPTFIELVTTATPGTALVVRIGAAEIEVRRGFDPDLLGAVVVALGGAA